MQKGGILLTCKINNKSISQKRLFCLAVYADNPATQKITLTGSACPMCFTPVGQMSAGRAYDNEVQYIPKMTHLRTLQIIKRTLHSNLLKNAKFYT